MRYDRIHLSSICEINPEVIGKDFQERKIKYIDISAVGTGVLNEKPKHLLLKDAPSRAKRVVRSGDTIISTVRPNRRSFLFINDDLDGSIASTGFVVLRPKKGVSPDFVFAAVTENSFTDFLMSHAKGAAYPAVSADDIGKGLVPDAGNFQQWIGHVSGVIHRKVIVNISIDRTLEEINRTLFKRWFIDFEFPDENGEPYKSSGGEMVDSELGEIPKGWSVVSMIDVFLVHGGGTPKTGNKEFWGGPHPFFTPRDAASVYVIDTEREITEAGLNSCNSKLFPTDTIFITARGTVGKVSLAGRPMAMNQSCYALQAKGYFSQPYGFFLVRSVIQQLQQGAHGAVFDTITTETFTNQKVFAPPQKMVEKFSSIITPMLNEILRTMKEKKSLSEIRDTLLPKLLSGKIIRTK